MTVFCWRMGKTSYLRVGFSKSRIWGKDLGADGLDGNWCRNPEWINERCKKKKKYKDVLSRSQKRAQFNQDPQEAHRVPPVLSPWRMSGYSLGTAPGGTDFCTFLGCKRTWVKRAHTESEKDLKKTSERCMEWVWGHQNHLPQLQLKPELGRWHGHQRFCHTLPLSFMFHCSRTSKAVTPKPQYCFQSQFFLQFSLVSDT